MKESNNWIKSKLENLYKKLDESFSDLRQKTTLTEQMERNHNDTVDQLLSEIADHERKYNEVLRKLKNNEEQDEFNLVILINYLINHVQKYLKTYYHGHP